MYRYRISGTNYARDISCNCILIMVGSFLTVTVSDPYLLNPDPGYLVNIISDLDPERVFDDKN